MSAPAVTEKEIFEIDTPDIGCDGGGALGHPMVYLTVAAASGTVDCPYCGRHYVLKAGAGALAH